MDDWVQAIYETTGIPLQEETLSLSKREGQWWLEFHSRPILPVGQTPDPYNTPPSEIREALSRGMKQRLSTSLPQVRHLLNTLASDSASNVEIFVVSDEEGGPTGLSDGIDRGWPQFLLRLSAGGFDVEVDLNPYVPEDPFDLDELQRQAEIILQVARLT